MSSSSSKDNRHCPLNHPAATAVHHNNTRRRKRAEGRSPCQEDNGACPPTRRGRPAAPSNAFSSEEDQKAFSFSKSSMQVPALKSVSAKLTHNKNNSWSERLGKDNPKRKPSHQAIKRSPNRALLRNSSSNNNNNSAANPLEQVMVMQGRNIEQQQHHHHEKPARASFRSSNSNSSGSHNNKNKNNNNNNKKAKSPGLLGTWASSIRDKASEAITEFLSPNNKSNKKNTPSTSVADEALDFGTHPSKKQKTSTSRRPGENLFSKIPNNTKRKASPPPQQQQQSSSSCHPKTSTTVTRTTTNRDGTQHTDSTSTITANGRTQHTDSLVNMGGRGARLKQKKSKPSSSNQVICLCDSDSDAATDTSPVPPVPHPVPKNTPSPLSASSSQDPSPTTLSAPAAGRSYDATELSPTKSNDTDDAVWHDNNSSEEKPSPTNTNDHVGHLDFRATVKDTFEMSPTTLSQEAFCSDASSSSSSSSSALPAPQKMNSPKEDRKETAHNMTIPDQKVENKISLAFKKVNHQQSQVQQKPKTKLKGSAVALPKVDFNTPPACATFSLPSSSPSASPSRKSKKFLAPFPDVKKIFSSVPPKTTGTSSPEIEAKKQTDAATKGTTPKQFFEKCHAEEKTPRKESSSSRDNMPDTPSSRLSEENCALGFGGDQYVHDDEDDDIIVADQESSPPLPQEDDTNNTNELGEHVDATEEFDEDDAMSNLPSMRSNDDDYDYDDGSNPNHVQTHGDDVTDDVEEYEEFPLSQPTVPDDGSKLLRAQVESIEQFVDEPALSHSFDNSCQVSPTYGERKRHDKTEAGSRLNLTKVNNRKPSPTSNSQRNGKSTRLSVSRSASAIQSGRRSTKPKATRIIPGATMLRDRTPDERRPEFNPFEDKIYAPKIKFSKKSGRQSPASSSDSLYRPDESHVLNSSRRSKRNKPKVPETIELSSDSEVEEDSDIKFDPHLQFELYRIAIGKKIFHNGCEVKCDDKENLLRLCFNKKKNSPQKEIHDISLGQTIQGCWYFSEQVLGAGQNSGGELAGINFISFVITPDETNNLAKFTTSYNPGNDNKQQNYIVLDFRQEDGLMTTIAALHLTGIEPTRLDHSNAADYCDALLQDNKKRRGPRRDLTIPNPLTTGRKKDHLLLVYPFGADKSKIEDAVKDLKEVSGHVMHNNDASTNRQDETDMALVGRMTKDQTEASESDSNDKKGGNGRQRAHYVTIRVEDYERLEPGEWLNDSLVDFWMQWMSRNEAGLTSNFHFFTSHFYTTLEAEGHKAVESWTAKKKINIFEKKMIFIPINRDLHWSLLVVVNPGAIVGAEDEQAPLSCLIFLDSLKMHNEKKVDRNIRKWLNAEWKVVKGEESKLTNPFDDDKFRLFTPRVPYQNNGWDCGIFVCRYSFAIYQLRDRTFTYGDAGLYRNRQGRGSGAFYNLITDGAQFNFDMNDIANFREEFRDLIEKLANLFSDWKKEKEARDRKLKAVPADKTATTNEEPGSEGHANTNENLQFEDPIENTNCEADITATAASEKENVLNQASDFNNVKTPLDGNELYEQTNEICI